MWQEVRRRRVGKVVVAYLAVWFAGFEAVTYLMPLVGGPAWLGRAILGALVLGFPVSVVLAWTYDITPSGVVRTPDDFGSEEPSEPTRHLWWILTATAAIIGLVLRFLRV